MPHHHANFHSNRPTYSWVTDDVAHFHYAISGDGTLLLDGSQGCMDTTSPTLARTQGNHRFITSVFQTRIRTSSLVLSHRHQAGGRDCSQQVNSGYAWNQFRKLFRSATLGSRYQHRLSSTQMNVVSNSYHFSVVMCRLQLSCSARHTTHCKHTSTCPSPSFRSS